MIVLYIFIKLFTTTTTTTTIITTISTTILLVLEYINKSCLILEIIKGSIIEIFFSSANYQAYAAYGAAAAAAAAANSFDQYQAAYNAAAAFNMQQQPRGNQTQNGKNGAHAPSGVSISQPAQRYDYFYY